MRPTVAEVASRLVEVGSAPAPPPRPWFLSSLEARLVSLAAGDDMDEMAVAAGPPAPVRPRRRALAVTVLAAAAAAALVLPGGDRAPSRIDVTGHGGTPVATASTTPPAPPTTAVTGPPQPDAAPAQVPAPTAPPPAPVAGPRRRVPGVPTTTATTVAPWATIPPTREWPGPATTTTSPTAVERLSIACRAGMLEGRPAVRCQWSESTSPSFAGYRLLRRAGDGTVAKVFAVADRSVRAYTDHGVEPGVTYGYVVEAKDAGGRVVGRSGAVRVGCCPP